MPRSLPPARSNRTHWAVLHPRRVERCTPASVIVLSQLQVVALRCIPTATCPMPGHESRQVRSARSARPYEGSERVAKPTAARRSWARWSLVTSTLAAYKCSSQQEHIKVHEIICLVSEH